MAIVISNFLLRGLSGAIGKTIVIRHCKGKTIVTKFPDWSHARCSKKQEQTRQRFKAAAAYAKEILADAGRREEYKKKVQKGKSVYCFALGEFMRGGV